jgi:23S rRNA (uracil-5-)-methyltransferase RumA
MLIDLVTTSQPLIPVEKHSEISSLSLYDREAFAAGRKEAAEGVKKLDQAQVLEAFTQRLLEVQNHPAFEGTIRGILHTVNDTLADAVRNDGTDILFGQEHITEELLGLEFRISPFSFFQTNTRAAEKLYEKVREYIALTPGSLVYDLYSGTGTIGQMLSPVAGRVCGVEIVEEAVAAARENAAANGLSNCEFIAGDVLKMLDSLPADPDYIVVDPPRDGIHPKALARLSRSGAKRIVYVSCKASSLARDLPMLALGGYRTEKMVLCDLFPKTDNIEVVVLLQRMDST